MLSETDFFPIIEPVVENVVEDQFYSQTEEEANRFEETKQEDLLTEGHMNCFMNNDGGVSTEELKKYNMTIFQKQVIYFHGLLKIRPYMSDFRKNYTRPLICQYCQKHLSMGSSGSCKFVPIVN